MQYLGKLQNLSYSSVVIDWNHLEPHLLATGATNGNNNLYFISLSMEISEVN